jgi:hypothetical protein
MLARIATTIQVPEPQDMTRGFQLLVDTIACQPGCAGVYGLAPVDSSGSGLISLWDSAGDARRCVADDQRQPGPCPGEPAAALIYQVCADLGGISRYARPTATGMVCFTGPQSETTTAAGRRARRELIGPAVLAVPGYVRMIAPFQPETRIVCELNLLTCTEAWDAARQAADSVPRPPETHWVRHPDRVELYSVTAIGARHSDRSVAAHRRDLARAELSLGPH